MNDVPQTIAQAYVRTTRRLPNKEAVVSADGRRYTYPEVQWEVERLSTALHTLGCQPGDHIAIWLANCPEWVFAEFACALLGLVIVPINARFRADEAAYVLKSGRAKVLLLQPKFLSNNYLERLQEIAAGNLGSGDEANVESLPELRSIVLTDGEPLPGTVALSDLLVRAEDSHVELDFEMLAKQREPQDPVLIFWTSGSTGRPKGAVVPQECIGNVWNWSTHAAAITEHDRVLTSFPLFYIAGNFWCLLTAMVQGATLVMSEEFDAGSVVKACAQEKVTVLSGIPTMLKEIVHDPAFEAPAFASVRVGFFGGASMPYQDIVTLIERIGYDHLLQAYGMTETQGIAISTTVNDSREVQLTTCGQPLPGFDLKLIDPDNGDEVAGMGSGEAWFKGRTHLTYFGMPAEQLQTFYSEDGYYRTGDVINRRSDGRYEFVTRIKDLIKVGGENVAAAEIERVLKDHPSIFNVQVVGIYDDRRGEIPAAFIELEPGAERLTLDSLQAWSAERMAPFKLPRKLRLMNAEEWPRTQSAKIARFQLEALLD
ncbi:MAG: class I adenylate-forming enzyme family protein [Gammaproteobacteria bacterium]